MAANRVNVLALLLVYGVLLMGTHVEHAGAKVCPFYCRADAAYMICESSGSTKLSPACNCCFAGKGCTIYYDNGTHETC
ncbi:hypothetical protein NMG60_11022000 [Bertholletia excelsa]